MRIRSLVAALGLAVLAAAACRGLPLRHAGPAGERAGRGGRRLCARLQRGRGGRGAGLRAGRPRDVLVLTGHPHAWSAGVSPAWINQPTMGRCFTRRALRARARARAR